MTKKESMLAVDILQSTYNWKSNQLDWEYTNSGISIFDKNSSEFHSTNIIQLFGIFNSYLTYNSYKNKIELIIF